MPSNVENTMRATFEFMLKKFKGARPQQVLFTTFNYSADFFEDNVLPLLAGNSVEELKGISTVTANLNNTLEEIKTVVICDHSAKPTPKGNLRYGLMPVGLKKGRFHPKIILMSGELEPSKESKTGGKGLWLSVGSGNLTLSGWAINREVVGNTKVVKKHKYELKMLLEWLQEKANHLFNNQSRNEEGKVRDVLNTLLQSLEENSLETDEEDLYPDLFLAKPDHRDGDLLKRLKGQKRWSKVTIVSPYWSGVAELLEIVKADNLFFVPSVRPTDGNYIFPRDTKNFNSLNFKQYIKEPTRFTHAKAIFFENRDEHYLCIGSANFTKAAMTNSSDSLNNIEMMLRYPVSRNIWKNLFKELDHDKIAEPDSDEESEGAPLLPPFNIDVLYDWKNKKFIYNLEIYQPITFCSMELGGGCIKFDPKIGIKKGEKPFSTQKPVKSYLVYYSHSQKSTSNLVYRGLVQQIGAADDELGYLPQPKLQSVLDVLLRLNPNQKQKEIERRADRIGSGENHENEEIEFDAFKFFQATFKLREFYKNTMSDPFSATAPQGIPILFRAISLQGTERPASKINKYIQLTELKDTINSVMSKMDTPENNEIIAIKKNGDKFIESSELDQIICNLEQEILGLLRESKTFVSMFGGDEKVGNDHCTHAFIDWFKRNIEVSSYA